MPSFSIVMSTALSSAAQISQPANLAWRNGCPITAAIYFSSTGNSSATVTLQYTMDDIQLIGGTSLALWASVSTAQGQAGTVWSASSVSTDGIFYTFLTPVAALRINSTSGIATGPIILKVIQGESW